MTIIPKPDLAVFVLRLNAVLKSRRIKQKDLAAILGLSTNIISCYATGKNAPSISELYRIASALDVSTDWLLGRDTEDASKDARIAQLEATVQKLAAQLALVIKAVEPLQGMPPSSSYQSSPNISIADSETHHPGNRRKPPSASGTAIPSKDNIKDYPTDYPETHHLVAEDDEEYNKNPPNQST